MTTMLRIGTRGSQLALWQARTVASRVAESGGPACELVVIKTTGDRLSEANLSTEGGKRLFVKEIEDALLEGRVDLAVHSSKDMPAVLPEGLVISGVLPREDPRDAVALPLRNAQAAFRRAGERTVPTAFEEPDDAASVGGLLPGGTVLGTSSVRRVAQLAQALPHLRFAPVRGNVDTRLRKLDDGQFGAIVLAVAGMKRLGLAGRISAALPVSVCVPAPGQGIVAVETRADDRATAEHVSRIADAPALAALAAERALVDALGGGCQLPIGALAVVRDHTLDMVAVVAAIDGSEVFRASGVAPVHEAPELGRRVAGELVQAGAGRVLDAIRGRERPSGA